MCSPPAMRSVIASRVLSAANAMATALADGAGAGPARFVLPFDIITPGNV